MAAKPRSAEVVKTRLDDIIVDPTVNVRPGLDEELIEDYMAVFDELPPVVVYRTAKGLLLSAGFHRYAAARRLGRKEILAEVRDGTRDDALEYGAVENTKHGKRLVRSERSVSIVRLKSLHPDWSATKIGEVVGVSPRVAQTVLAAERVRRAVPEAVSLVEGVLEPIASLPPQRWGEAVEAAINHGWSSRETEVAVRILKSPREEESYKRAILEGRAQPIALSGGEALVLPDTVARLKAEADEKNPRTPLWKLMALGTSLRIKWRPGEVVSGMDRKDVDHLVVELPILIRYLGEMHEETERIAKGPRGVKLELIRP